MFDVCALLGTEVTKCYIFIKYLYFVFYDIMKYFSSIVFLSKFKFKIRCRNKQA